MKIIKKYNKQRAGFTLMEVLIVVVIIGVLATLTAVIVTNVRAKTRDAKRTADIKQVQTALELYRLDEATYPTSITFGQPLIGPTSGTTYMAATPEDPLSATGKNYSYKPISSANSASVAFNEGRATVYQTDPGAGPYINYSILYNLETRSSAQLPGAAVATAGSTYTSCAENCVNKCNGEADGCGGYCSVCVYPETCGGGGSLGVCGWTCGINTVSDMDGNIYHTVLIGSQCWMQENLNVGVRIDVANHQGDYVNGIQKYCFNNSDSSCITDGGLYQWHMAMALPQICDVSEVNCSMSGNVQGICPVGWHVPSLSGDYTLLSNFLYNTDVATKLKMIAPIWNGNNLSGFSAWPAGYSFVSSKSFYSRGIETNFWSSSFSQFDQAWGLLMGMEAHISHSQNDKGNGLSVRCVKN